MHRISMLWVNPEGIVDWSNISKVRTISFFVHSVLKICRTRDRFAYNFLQNHPNSTLRYSKCIVYVCCEWIRKELSIGVISQKLGQFPFLSTAYSKFVELEIDLLITFYKILQILHLDIRNASYKYVMSESGRNCRLE